MFADSVLRVAVYRRMTLPKRPSSGLRTVVPDDTPQETKVYMPSDQAKVLMAQNDEVKNLVQDLELDIK